MVASATVLRQETVERLNQLSPDVFKFVFDSRQPQLRREMLPAVRVYTSSTSQGISISNPEFRTTTSLIVQVCCEDVNDAATAARVDALAEAVKIRLLGDGSWLRLFEHVTSMETDVDRNIEGEWRMSVCTITFALQCTEFYEPVFPDWLETIHMDVDVIDPAADPNTGEPGVPPNVQPQPPGYHGGFPGPDGRIEVSADFLTRKPTSED